MQWAGSHVGRTLATLDADGVEEVVFDIVPRKVSADASESGPFIEAVRALYRWLRREFELPQAQDCQAVLDAPDAVPWLEALMSDPGSFDPTVRKKREAKRKADRKSARKARRKSR